MKAASYLRKDSQEYKAKKKNPKIHAIPTKKSPRILPVLIVMAHLEKYVFCAQIASCGHMKNGLMAVPTVCAENCRTDEIGILY